MSLRDPLVSLSFALTHATRTGLNAHPGDEAPAACSRRPRTDECEVVMFGHCWSSSDLGADAACGNAMHEGQATVVMGPRGDACVYFGPRFAYHVEQPNRRFFLDVAAQRLEGVRSARAYEGRDTEVIESVDYALEMEMSRLEVLTRREPQKSTAISKLLSFYASRFARIGDEEWLMSEALRHAGASCLDELT